MNPLTVLEKVFFHLNLEDLKTCRQVNKSWNHESTLALRNTSAQIPIGSSSSLKDIITLANQSCGSNPLTKFNLSSHLLLSPNWPLLNSFFEIFSSELESLSITLDKESVNPVEEKEMKFSFPKLREVRLTGHGLDNLKEGVKLPLIFQEILSGATRIDKLSLMFDTECRETVKALLKFLPEVHQNLKFLQKLEIYIPVGDDEISALSKVPCKLRKLKCDFHFRSSFNQETLKGFLQVHSSTLEYLKFDNYYGTSCYSVEFPVMSKITTLKIDGKSELSTKEVKFLAFSYAKQFPSLSKLVLGGSIQFNQCWEMLFPEDIQLNTLNELKLTAKFIDPLCLQRIGNIFPSLKSLYCILAEGNQSLANVIFEAFPNIKSLTMELQPNLGNIDGLLTGFEEDECERWRNGGVRSPTASSSKGLTKLTKLEILRFKSDAGNAPHISDVTIYHCLTKMKNLKHVVTPPFMFSTDALKSLESNLESLRVMKSS